MVIAIFFVCSQKITIVHNKHFSTDSDNTEKAQIHTPAAHTYGNHLCIGL